MVGHSIGANAMMHLAVNHPERVERLVIIAGTILTEGGPPPAITRIASSPAFAALLTNTLRSLPDMVGEEVMSAEVAERYLALWEFPGWEDALVNVIKTSTGNLLAEETLQTIEIPALVIWGENDTLMPLTDGERLASLLPHATWKPYADAGHLVMSEASEQFNADVIAFLQEADL
jgi:rifampin ADP-ribosylating transferase